VLEAEVMLTIDSRENSDLSNMVEITAKKFNLSIERQWIEVGDYVAGNVCFEAKSTHDFLSSLMSKRMWTQIDNMDRCYETNIIIIHGTLAEALSYTDYSTSKMPIRRKKQLLTNKFYGGLGRIAMDTDMKPLWVADERTAANIICTMAKMQPMDRPEIKPHLHKRITTDDLRINMLSHIKGVSENKAKKLLDQFGCLMEIGDLTKTDLCRLDGIGETTAKRILDVFNSEKKVKQ
jgi:ERCC4-type nuclease